MLQWMQWCQQSFDLVKVQGRLICIGDGIKLPKEAKRQPGLKWMHHSSQNNNKPNRFIGHHFGCIAFIAACSHQYRAILQAAQLHEGVDAIRQLDANENNALYEKESVVVRMLSLIVIVAIRQKQPLYACLDAYFATAPAFVYANSFLMDNKQPWVHLITKAKSNYVAYLIDGQKKKKTFKLTSLFKHQDWFETAPHPLHPKRTVKFYWEDLYWGALGLNIRFVWVIDQGHHFILMSSDQSLPALEILKIYGLRFNIEASFYVLKHVIGGFYYHFWSKLLVTATDKTSIHLSWTKDNPMAINLLKKLEAIERFVNLAIIAQGILSYFALMKTKLVWGMCHHSSWLRTYSSNLPSEETVQRACQVNILWGESTMIYTWIKKQCKLDLKQKKMTKVPNHATLKHFLLT